MGKIGSKLLIAVALSWIWALVCAPPARGQSWSNGYAFRRTITIDHTKVANSDQTNFPVLVSGTYTDMATVANGGSLTNSNGYDVVFTADAAGTTPLPFEREFYNPSSGAFTYWVKIPTLSYTTDTTVYLFYGNSSITSDQANKTAVWDANYVGVWHLPNGTTLSSADSTNNANAGTITGATASSGQIDGAASFSGGQDVSIGANAGIQPSNLTLSFWFNRGSSSQGSYAHVLEKGTDQHGAPYGSYFAQFQGTDSTSIFVGLGFTDNSDDGWAAPTGSIAANTWYYLTMTYDGNSIKVYQNGTLMYSHANTRTIFYDGTPLTLGANNTGSGGFEEYLNGIVDEVRLSKVGRSADWIATEYKNQSSSSSFALVGSASPGPSSPFITRLSVTAASSGDPVSIQGGNFGTSQGNSTVSFGGATISAQSWSDTGIGVLMPFRNGAFSVTVNGVTAVSPTIVAATPHGWSDIDIGTVGTAGSSTYTAGSFSVQATGNDIYGSADGFHFFYQPLSGDGSIVARVVTLQGGGAYQKAGVMIRETLTAGSTNAYTAQQGTGTTSLFDYRSTTGGSTTQTGGSASLPYWVKLTRSGNNFSGYTSSDGVNWIQLGSSQAISMAQSVYVGLAVASNNNSAVATAVFDNVSLDSTANPAPVISSVSATTGAVGSQVVISGLNFGISQGGSVVLLNGGPATINSWSPTSITITIPVGASSGPMVVLVAPAMNDSNAVDFSVTSSPLPTGWLDQDVGAVGLAGSATFANGVFTIQGAGQDIYGIADGLHFMYQPLSGDGALVARVVSLQGGGTYPKAGAMVREALTAGSTNAYTAKQGTGTTILFDYRIATGGTTGQAGGSASLPYWMKVVRSGNSFSGYTSSDGVNWVQLGTTQTISMAQNVDIGLAVTSSTTTGLATATFDNVSLQVSSISGELVGTITRANDGTLVSGAQVRALQSGTVRTTVTSGSDGRYVFTALTAGLYDISTSASGFGTTINASVSIPAGVISRLDVSLTSPGTLQGQVTQSNGTTGISGAVVQASAGQSSAGQVTADSNGNYTLGSLGPGTYQVQASASNYVPFTQSASVTAGSSTTKNFSLQASTAVPITYVYDALGRLVGVINPSGDTAVYNYDAVGNLFSISRHNSAQLSIITFTPGKASIGTAVTIYGTGFSSTTSQNTVQFNGITATVQAASPTQLVVTVPSTATTGPISVTTSAGTATSGSSFTVQ